MIRSHHRPLLTLFIAVLPLIIPTACSKKSLPETNTPAISDSNAKIDEILQRYQTAVGGAEAVERVVSYKGKGRFTTSVSNFTGTYEVWGKDPDKTVSIITFSLPFGPPIAIKKGFDGTTRWLQTPVGTQEVEGSNEMAEVERDADIYRAGKIKNLYKTMQLEPNARLHGRDVYVVEGKPDRGPSDKLFFDVKDGYLLRWDMVRRNPQRGNVFVKVHLENYRDVDGVKVPFTVRFSFESFYLNLTIDELKHNVDVDDRFFKKPGS